MTGTDPQVSALFAAAQEASATRIEAAILHVNVWQLLFVIAKLIEMNSWRKSADGATVSFFVEVSDDGIATLWQPETGTGAALTQEECKHVAGKAIKQIAENLITRFMRTKA